MTTREKRWVERARRDLLAELEYLHPMGYACNVQEWVSYGVMKNELACKARRRAAHMLLKIAVAAVKNAQLRLTIRKVR